MTILLMLNMHELLWRMQKSHKNILGDKLTQCFSNRVKRSLRDTQNTVRVFERNVGIIKSLEQGPSLEANSSSASQEISRILWNV